MNVVFLSPNFPPQFYLFCTALKARGATVLGIGDSPPHDVRPELHSALTEYVYLPRLDEYEALHRAVAGLIWRYGRIDRVDSHNEHWLGVEARLREDYNIPGQRPAEAARHRSKAGMGEVFRAAGIPHPEVEAVRSAEGARAFVARVGLPVIFKPEVGVGAGETFKVSTPAELEAALARPLQGYVVQRFASGRIVTYDGLSDASGRVVFATSHVYNSGVMEIVTEGRDVWFYSRRVIPPALEAVGRKAVQAFNIRERFFHLEFFEQPDGSHVALEVNLRPPGGFTLDMMNYACDLDLYALWARMLTGEDLADFSYQRRYHAAHVSRRRGRAYRLSHEQALARMGSALMVYRELPHPISLAMGDQVFILRHESEPELLELIRAVQELA